MTLIRLDPCANPSADISRKCSNFVNSALAVGLEIATFSKNVDVP